MSLGACGLTPQVFWTMTPFELWCLMEGKLAVSGHVKPLTRDELEKLEARVAADRAAKEKAAQ